MNAPSGSHLRDWEIGLNTRKYGAASVPVDAAHCQPPLLAARSPSTRFCMKNRSPRRQSRNRFFERNMATTIRSRLCIQPVARS
jgi:hypothetical protein